MAEIKLFVSCHQLSSVPEHPLLVPVQVGAALSTEHFPGFCYDDEGENISSKNRSYCELTAQYWAWKNVQADYYGFFHYRRYLYPDISAKRPYRIETAPTLELLDKLGYKGLETLISQYNLILPKREDMHIPAREHYAKAPFHHKKDLDLIEEIIRENYSEYVPATEEYLSGTQCYFGNIFIMNRELLEEYSNWLFSVLEEFDCRADVSGYGPQELRVDGYLAERLLGIFCTRLQAEGTKMLELPRVDFIPNAKERKKRQLVNSLLPPGSQRRAIAKRFKK